MFNKIADVSRRANTFARILAEPGLYRLWKDGGIPLTYLELKQPWIKALNIKTVLDVGANAGAFATTVHALFPDATVHAFEPLPDVYAALKQRASSLSRLRVHNLGLGEQDGELVFHRTQQDVSSSFLQPGATFERLSGITSETDDIRVAVRALDSVAAEQKFEGPLFVKLDVQGYEDRVIRGGGETLKRTALLLAETSAVPQYGGAATFAQLVAMLDAMNFDYGGTIERVVTHPTGRIVSEDALFVNRALVAPM